MASRRPDEEKKWDADQPMKGEGTGGHTAGEAAFHGMKMGASEIQLYLKGLNYPASKMDLVNKAKTNSAPSSIVDFLNRIPEKQYSSQNMVEQEFTRMK